MQKKQRLIRRHIAAETKTEAQTGKEGITKRTHDSTVTQDVNQLVSFVWVCLGTLDAAQGLKEERKRSDFVKKKLERK